MSHPFSRFTALMSLAAAFMSRTPGSNIAQAVSANGGYIRRGKGEGRPNRSAAGAGMAAKRASTKARNKRLHKKACRG